MSGLTLNQECTRPELYEHLTQLPGVPWALWRCTALRAAGFPAAQVLELAAPELAAAADRLIEAEAQESRALKEALAALHLDSQNAEGNKLGSFEKARRQLSKGLSLSTLSVGQAIAEAIRELDLARQHTEEARVACRSAAESAAAHISNVLRRVAGDERFREAVTWQNRHAVHGSIDALLRMGPGSSRNSERHKREELVANYLQRYCVKNDSIGFFGPVGWASFTDQDETIVVREGKDLIASRQVYFEGWCIDALAAKLAENKALRPWIVPRRMPFVHLEGTTFYMLLGHPARLTAKQAAALEACDGKTLAKDIARDLVQRQAFGLENEEEVYSLLEYLDKRGLISWTLEIPVKLNPERLLLELLERIQDDDLRTPAIAALNELENCRGAVARAAGDSEKLDQSLNNLEETFMRLTGVAPTRAAGEMYASRTLVYEDCRRDIEIRLGPKVLCELSRSLVPFLTSARWFTYQTANVYRQSLREIYEELSRKSKSSIVSFSTFWLHTGTTYFSPEKSPDRLILPLFQKRWAQILGPQDGRRQIEYKSEELGPQVTAAFAAPHAGWGAAHYHSPDLMISAASTEAIQRGDFELVLGELHLGANTLINSFFYSQHSSPEELSQSVDLDLPARRIMPVVPKSWPGLTVRTSYPLSSPKDLFLEIDRDAYGLVRSQVIPISSLVVEDVGEQLVVRTRDGKISFDIVEVFGEVFSSLVVNCAKFLFAARHSPRIKFDRLVVGRESWQFTAAEMAFAFEKDRTGRFVAARRWARNNDLPRFVFVKAPVEVKPFYVDFDSPTYIDLLARIVRRSVSKSPDDEFISVSEMLPRFGEMWLPDAKGERYTGELRIVALDLL